jgi:IS605 OrfB family transposase
LSTSTVIDKWEKEVIKPKLKTLKIQLKMNQQQRKIIDNWINTSNYVYNKTLEKINNGHVINFNSLRDLLVTDYTKKDSKEYKYYDELSNNLRLEKINIINDLSKNKLSEELKIKLENKQKEIDKFNQTRRDSVKKIKSTKNIEVKSWELKTPKEIRAAAVNDVCKAYNTAFSNLKNNNITNFKLDYRKKKNPNKCILIPKNYIKFKNNHIQLAPKFFKNNKNFKLTKKTLKNHTNLKINNDVRLTKYKNKYYLHIPIIIKYTKPPKLINYCGVDPGLRSFLTVFGNNSCYEYKHDKLKLNKLNRQIDSIKSRLKTKRRIRKKALNKRETTKSNLVDEIHWKSINNLLNNNDVIFYGDIKSHNIVKHKKYRYINRACNDLKFYIFKERLLYKASTKNKYVICVNEAYTTQTCSYCGKINKPKASEIYYCSNCHIHMGRDINAAKNILMKGIISYL